MAMRKNGEYIGDRYVKLLHVPKREMEEQVKFGTAAIPKHGQMPLVPNLQSQISQSQIQQHLTGLQHALGQAGVGLYAVSTGMPMAWGSQDLTQIPLSHTPLPSPAAMPLVMGSIAPAPQISSGPSIRNDGSTIKIRGLPFRATESDILEFFEGYDVVIDSVRIGVDGSGRPTGDGWITFANHEEAKRAVRERNKKYLQHRYLELSPVQP